MGYGVALRAPASVNYYHRKAKQTIEVGAWIATPGWLRDQVEKLKSEYVTMGKEMLKQYNDECIAPGFPNSTNLDSERCKKMDRFYEEVWRPLAARFYKFADNHSGGSYFRLIVKNFWGNVWDSIKDYRHQLIALREQAEEAGFFFQAPKPLPPEKGPWDTISTMSKWVFGALIGTAAVLLVTMLINAIRR